MEFTRREWLAGALAAAAWSVYRPRSGDVALKPENPVVGGNVLRRQAIESPNYVPGTSGWTIKQDGSAEFNNLTIRGTFFGTDFIINSFGAFFYSGVPAAGNLAISIAPAAGTDQFGNAYQAGIVSYSSANVWAQLLVGVLNFQSAAGQPVLANVSSAAAGAITMASGTVGGGDTIAQVLVESAQANDGTHRLIQLIGEFLTLAGITTITGSAVTSMSIPNATVDVSSGNLNLNMAQPPNYAAVVAGTATQAQYNACLGGLVQSMHNRLLIH